MDDDWGCTYFWWNLPGDFSILSPNEIPLAGLILAAKGCISPVGGANLWWNDSQDVSELGLMAWLKSGPFMDDKPHDWPRHGDFP